MKPKNKKDIDTEKENNPLKEFIKELRIKNPKGVYFYGQSVKKDDKQMPKKQKDIDTSVLPGIILELFTWFPGATSIEFRPNEKNQFLEGVELVVRRGDFGINHYMDIMVFIERGDHFSQILRCARHEWETFMRKD